MKKDLGKTLKNEQVRYVRLRRAIRVAPETSLETVLEKMAEGRTGGVLVEEKGKLIGILTERDFLTRVIGPNLSLKTAIREVMTPNPKCLTVEDSIAKAISVMSQGGYRRLPILNKAGQVEGVLSVKGLIQYLADHFPCEVFNLPPDPNQIQRTPEGA